VDPLRVGLDGRTRGPIDHAPLYRPAAAHARIHRRA
jgi:hypothetical protein